MRLCERFSEALQKLKGGLRALYRTLALPGANPLKDAHAALDVAVMDAYGFSAKKDLLAQISRSTKSSPPASRRANPSPRPACPGIIPTIRTRIPPRSLKPTPRTSTRRKKNHRHTGRSRWSAAALRRFRISSMPHSARGLAHSKALREVCTY